MADTTPKTMSVKILQVCKTTAQWAEVTDVISKGLLGIEFTTTGKAYAKVGDGTKTWAELPYIGNDDVDLSLYYTKTETDTKIAEEIAGIGKVVTIKGVKETVEELPTSDNNVGDIWFVGTGNGQDAYTEYVWVQPDAEDETSAKWEYIGKVASAIQDATTTQKGVIKIATEIPAGTTLTGDTDTAATPALVKGYVDAAVGAVDTGVASVSGTINVVTVTGDEDVTITLADTVGTDGAGTFGQTTTTTLSDGDTFNIPKVTVDKYGRVTAIENIAVTAGSHDEYELPAATATTLGGVKTGTNITIAEDGTISAIDTTYTVFDGAQAAEAGTTGLVPAPAAGETSKYLKSDGTWATPDNTTYEVFDGATAADSDAGTEGAAGTTGLVPAPAATDAEKFLKGDGSWAVAYDDAAVVARVRAIEDDYIKSTDTLILNCTL